MEKKTIRTVFNGCNSSMIQGAFKIHCKDGDLIADVTYGKGVFYKDIPPGKYSIIGSDIKTGVDFRSLPYDDNEFDHSVIDPPYARNDLKSMIECYNLNRSVKHEDILNLYKQGIQELKRVTKPGGCIFVKCQDEVYACKNWFTHIEIYDFALSIGLSAKDLFIFVSDKKPKARHKQQHARKNHSYLWVFKV